MAEEEKVPYHYIVVRADLPLDALIVNVAHAAGESLVEAPIPKTTRLVLLQVPNALELAETAVSARMKGFTVADVYEPDPPYNGALMAIGLAPSTRRNQLRKLFYHCQVLDVDTLSESLNRLKCRLQGLLPEKP